MLTIALSRFTSSRFDRMWFARKSLRDALGTSLLDEVLPHYQFSEYHCIDICASEDRIFNAVVKCDLNRSHTVRCLFRLRGLQWALTVSGLRSTGFLILANAPPREFVLGAVGRLWSIRKPIRRIERQDFDRFEMPGYAKLAGNALIESLPNGVARLHTETRVYCTSRSSRIKFGLYWWLIRPFSGWVRHELMRLVRQEAEGSAG